MTLYAAMVTIAAIAAFPVHHARVTQCPGVVLAAGVGEQLLADGSLDDWRLFHHPAPVVTLKTSSDCGLSPMAWQGLSSRDLSNSWTPLPASGLTATIESAPGVVELLMDGRPIQPVAMTTAPWPSPSVVCPSR